MKRTLFMGIFICFCVLPDSVLSEDGFITLPSIVVEGKFNEEDFAGPLFTETNTKTKITEKGINALGPCSSMSVPMAIGLIPSVSQQSVDPIGLSDISNYHESFRFRGTEPTGGGNPSTPVNVENLPVSGRPGGGANIYDLENMESISIYKGGVPADKAFGLTNIGGKIDMEILRPQEKFHYKFRQAAGSNDFRRSFARLDTGLFPSKTAGFFSYSNTMTDKWKGEGDSKRDNLMLGFTQKIHNGFNIEAFCIYNDFDIHTYRPFNYASISSLGENYRFDYSENPNDYFYYDYNKSDFKDYNILMNFKYEFNEDSSLIFKPFYWKDKGNYLETITMQNGNNRIRKWDVDHELTGFISQYSQKIQSAAFNAGFFYLEQERPGPPTAWKLYKVSSGSLAFDKWQLLSNSSKHRQKTPFVSGQYTAGPLTIDGGIKYLIYSMPGITTYDSAGLPDVSHHEALAMAPPVEENASAAPKDFDKILPNLGLSYTLNDSLSCYFSYGRNISASSTLLTTRHSALPIRSGRPSPFMPRPPSIFKHPRFWPTARGAEAVGQERSTPRGSTSPGNEKIPLCFQTKLIMIRVTEDISKGMA